MRLFIGQPNWKHNTPIRVGHNIPYRPALIRNYVYRFICRLNESHDVTIDAINNSVCKYDSLL